MRAYQNEEFQNIIEPISSNEKYCKLKNIKHHGIKIG